MHLPAFSSNQIILTFVYVLHRISWNCRLTATSIVNSEMILLAIVFKHLDFLIFNIERLYNSDH